MHSSSRAVVPKRDGLMFSQPGSTGSARTSATEWIGASKLSRALLPAQHRSALAVERRVLEHGVREELDDGAVQLGIRHDVDRRAV